MPPPFNTTIIDNAPSALALVTALVTVLTEERTPSGCCTNSWLELVGGRCYYANSTSAVSWRQANDTCRALNAVLAYPANNDEQILLQDYISSRWGHQTVHIGIYYDRFQKQWKNVDNVRSIEKPNSDKTSAGDWCSSLVPYPWYEKSAFIMQIVDCKNVKAPFMCQSKGCMNAQCDVPPCDEVQEWSTFSIREATQPTLKKTTSSSRRNVVQANFFGPNDEAKTTVFPRKINAPAPIKPTASMTKSFTTTTRVVRLQPPTSSPSAASQSILHNYLISLTIAQCLFQQLLFNNCLYLHIVQKANLH